jgi:hypothetical protein
MITFRQFLGKYGLTLLPVGIETTVPGDILKRERRGYYPYAKMKKVADNDLNWNVGWTGANITEEKVSRTLSLNGKYSLKTMGVNINGGLSKAKSATYTISGVKAKKLVELTTMEVEQFLDTIKNKKSAWKKIKGKEFVELTFYATEFTIDFEVDRGIDLKAEVAQKISHEASAKVEWTTKTSLRIASNDNIPFGFKGFRIR